MDNNTISLQELLDSISRLREDVTTLTVAFSYLAFSREQMQSTLASIQFESCNPKWSQEQQDSFRRLAVLLDEKYAGKITISADSSENP